VELGAGVQHRVCARGQLAGARLDGVPLSIRSGELKIDVTTDDEGCVSLCLAPQWAWRAVAWRGDPLVPTGCGDPPVFGVALDPLRDTTSYVLLPAPVGGQAMVSSALTVR
jgi:hypothetical protein